ncbi:hypothetical protein [Rhizobium sp. BE258]|uniref:hypothetical protein n=1 Tax=Rhizobium sp. BE258 TaxID=2817722 RepID=UPI00285A917E|nr:hypothetical protein [Rhizobium sp. BE258]MDR7146162.1 hypothetical protein [Rhizobium sp. BE258]
MFSSSSKPAIWKMPEIPQLEEVSEAYASLIAKRANLSSRLSIVEGNIQKNNEILRDRKASKMQGRDKEPEIRNDRVASLLGETAAHDAPLPLEEETPSCAGRRGIFRMPSTFCITGFRRPGSMHRRKSAR